MRICESRYSTVTVASLGVQPCPILRQVFSRWPGGQGCSGSRYGPFFYSSYDCSGRERGFTTMLIDSQGCRNIAIVFVLFVARVLVSLDLSFVAKLAKTLKVFLYTSDAGICIMQYRYHTFQYSCTVPYILVHVLYHTFQYSCTYSTAVPYILNGTAVQYHTCIVHVQYRSPHRRCTIE